MRKPVGDLSRCRTFTLDKRLQILDQRWFSGGDGIGENHAVPAVPSSVVTSVKPVASKIVPPDV